MKKTAFSTVFITLFSASGCQPFAGGDNIAEDSETSSVSVSQATARLDGVFRNSLKIMKEFGNRIDNGMAGNIFRNTGFNKKLWKCEDQAPFVANQMRMEMQKSKILGVACIVIAGAGNGQEAGWHTFVAVGINSKTGRDANGFLKPVGGTIRYYDPWEGTIPGGRPKYAVGRFDCDRNNWEIERLGQNAD